MPAATEPQAASRKQLLTAAMELSDAIKRYQTLLGSDGGMAARLSRSSHRELFIEPAQRILSAWRGAVADFRGSPIEAAFERARFVERTEALRPLTDRQDDHPAWDEAVSTLSVDTKAFIDALVPPPVDQTIEASARLQPLRVLFDRYHDLIPFVDLGLLAYKADGIANIVSARITCTTNPPAKVHHDKKGWLAIRASLAGDMFPSLLDQIVAGQLELAEGSFSLSGIRQRQLLWLSNPYENAGEPSQTSCVRDLHQQQGLRSDHGRSLLSLERHARCYVRRGLLRRRGTGHGSGVAPTADECR